MKTRTTPEKPLAFKWLPARSRLAKLQLMNQCTVSSSINLYLASSPPPLNLPWPGEVWGGHPWSTWCLLWLRSRCSSADTWERFPGETCFAAATGASMRALLCLTSSSICACVSVSASPFPYQNFFTGYDNSQVFLCLSLVAAVQTNFRPAYDFNTSTCNMITLTVEQYRLSRTKPQGSFFNCTGNTWAPCAGLILQCSH
jgi:hypothetical protein